MARRRSMNRRASRRTMNYTDLDYDSNLIDSHDPMWWKNIEGDMTARQSRRSFFGNTTDPILSGESYVEPSELRKEWWKILDRTDVTLPRRSSPRQSVRRSESLHEFSDSDEAEDIGIKKQKLSLQTSRRRTVSTNKLSIAPNESSIRDETSSDKTGKSTFDDKDPMQMTVNTSADVDDASNLRPRPFKKRFTKIGDPNFQHTSVATGIPDTNEPSRQEETHMEDSDGEELMDFSTTASDRNKLLSNPRKVDLSKDNSESETRRKKNKLRLVRKVRKNVSINPHEELIENSFRSEHSDVERNARSKSKEANPKQLQDRKLSSTSTIRDPTRERSQTRRVEEPSDKEDEYNPDRSSTSSLTHKILGVSLTRMSAKEISDRKNRESDEGSKRETNKVTRSLRSSKDIIIESPYELPDHERSGISQITDSDNEKEKSIHQNSNVKRPLRVSFRSRDRNSHGLIDSTTEIPSGARNDYSRTRIFSDEDISVEDPGFLAERNDISSRPAEKSMRVTRRSAAANRYSRTIRFNESMSETEVIMPRAPIVESVDFYKNQNIRKTRSSGRKTLPNESQWTNDSDASSSKSESEVEIRRSTLTSNENSRRSRRIIADKSKHDDENERMISQGEREGEEEIDEESHVPRTNDKSDISGQNLTTRKFRTFTKPQNDEERSKNHSRSANDTPTKKSQKSIARIESLTIRSDDESEIQESTNSISMNNRSKENSRKFGSTTKNSQRNVSLDENADESGMNYPEAIDQRSGKSYSTERSLTGNKSSATNKTREFSRADRDTSEDKNEETEKNLTQTKNSHSMEKSRTAREGLVAKESHRRIDDDGMGNEREDSPEIALQHSPLNGKPRILQKRLATDKSRRINEYDESMSEQEEDAADRRSVRKSGKSFRDILFREDATEGRIDGEKSLAATRRKSVARSESTVPLFVDEDEIDEEDETKVGGESIGSSRQKSVAHSTSSRRNFNDEDEIAEENATEEDEESIGMSRRKSIALAKSTREHFSDEDGINEDNEESEENRHSPIGRKATSNAEPSKNVTTTQHPEPSAAAMENSYPAISPMNPPIVPNEPGNKRSNRLSTAKKDTRKQKNIKDFFVSKFLQKPNESGAREVQDSLDKEKFKLAMDTAKEMKKRMLKVMGLNEETKKKVTESAKPPKESVKKKNLPAKETAPKKPNKVINKAYIINGSVYKRPKLPRPKPWVTDRLYRHLWKLMEPKYGLAARVKSEKFILNLSQVVALTVRRKKYESYKSEIDALMKDMARLGLIKTRNDFYDFCYDFLPYDFRVKTTPILLPGNVNSIPYDPTKLHTPILEES